MLKKTTQTGLGSHIDWWSRVELKLRKRLSCEGVLICVQGGLGTLATCASYLKQGVPIVILKGTGRAADWIAEAVEEFKKTIDPALLETVNKSMEIKHVGDAITEYNKALQLFRTRDKPNQRFKSAVNKVLELNKQNIAELTKKATHAIQKSYSLVSTDSDIETEVDKFLETWIPNKFDKTQEYFWNETYFISYPTTIPRSGQFFLP